MQIDADARKTGFNGLTQSVDPLRDLQGVRPFQMQLSIAKRHISPSPVNASLRDSPRQVAFAKLAMLVHGGGGRTSYHGD